MQSARYYPSLVTVGPDARVVVVGGTLGATSPFTVDSTEIYNPSTGSWAALPTVGDPSFGQYPFAFLLQDGTVAVCGVEEAALGHTATSDTWVLNLTTGLWDNVATSEFSGEHGSAVMYDPGKVLKSGGLFSLGATATIDFNVVEPIWTTRLSMLHDRQEHTLVVLPNGMIVALGGTESGQPVLTAEWFDPEDPDQGWHSLAEMTYGRAHHMTAVLLLDGTVLVAGLTTSPGIRQAEIFRPPYLFTDNPRPEISTAPTSIRSDQTFTVRLGGAVPAEHIDEVNLLRLGAVTHSFDQNQRFVPLTFAVVNASTLSVSPVGDANRAPPGSYMLFVVSDAGEWGVPSEGRYIDVAAVAVVAP